MRSKEDVTGRGSFSGKSQATLAGGKKIAFKKNCWIAAMHVLQYLQCRIVTPKFGLSQKNIRKS
jgi:hypothetical protein